MAMRLPDWSLSLLRFLFKKGLFAEPNGFEWKVESKDVVKLTNKNTEITLDDLDANTYRVSNGGYNISVNKRNEITYYNTIWDFINKCKNASGLSCKCTQLISSIDRVLWDF